MAVLMQKARQLAMECAEAFFVGCAMPSSCPSAHTVVLLDDNMWYRSMRKAAIKMAHSSALPLGTVFLPNGSGV
jgi:hypothetical protein